VRPGGACLCMTCGSRTWAHSRCLRLARRAHSHNQPPLLVCCFAWCVCAGGGGGGGAGRPPPPWGGQAHSDAPFSQLHQQPVVSPTPQACA
jgi:hypothetical protein